MDINKSRETFVGLLNDNGLEYDIKLIIKTDTTIPEISDFFINNKKADFKIGKKKVTINNIDYEYRMEQKEKIFFIAGKETDGLLQLFAPCLFKNRYFAMVSEDKIPDNAN